LIFGPTSVDSVIKYRPPSKVVIELIIIAQSKVVFLREVFGYFLIDGKIVKKHPPFCRIFKTEGVLCEAKGNALVVFELGIDIRPTSKVFSLCKKTIRKQKHQNYSRDSWSAHGLY
jgi:hypothetical protein